jgi:hypothetical protein
MPHAYALSASPVLQMAQARRFSSCDGFCISVPNRVCPKTCPSSALSIKPSQGIVMQQSSHDDLECGVTVSSHASDANVIAGLPVTESLVSAIRNLSYPTTPQPLHVSNSTASAPCRRKNNARSGDSGDVRLSWLLIDDRRTRRYGCDDVFGHHHIR